MDRQIGPALLPRVAWLVTLALKPPFFQKVKIWALSSVMESFPQRYGELGIVNRGESFYVFMQNQHLVFRLGWG